jgi:PAS domain S-box-containing protein
MDMPEETSTGAHKVEMTEIEPTRFSGIQGSGIDCLALFETLPVGVFVLTKAKGDTRARLAYVNLSFLELFELQWKDIEGQCLSKLPFLHPGDLGHWPSDISHAVANEIGFKVQACMISDGVKKEVQVQAATCHLEDGTVLWIGSLAEKAQALSVENPLNAIIDASQAFTWTLNIQRQTVIFNNQWTQAHGYRPDQAEMTLEHWFQSLHPDDAPTVLIGLEALLSGKVERQTAVYRRRHSDGHWIWLRVLAGVSDSGPDGRPLVLSGVSFEITLEVAQHAGVVHDLNNLFLVIEGSVAKLQLRQHDHTWLQTGLDPIRQALGLARELTSGLGITIRPDQRKGTHDLRVLLRDSMELLENHHRSAERIFLDLPDEPVQIWVDPTEFSQVVVNLAVNACEAGTLDLPVEVTISAVQPKIELPQRKPDAGDVLAEGTRSSVLSITDNGSGIDKNVQAQMFRTSITTKGPAGTGLGLLVVAAILRSNRASVWVDSSPGKGTRIVVAWPSEDPRGVW